MDHNVIGIVIGIIVCLSLWGLVTIVSFVGEHLWEHWDSIKNRNKIAWVLKNDKGEYLKEDYTFSALEDGLAPILFKNKDKALDVKCILTENASVSEIYIDNVNQIRKIKREQKYPQVSVGSPKLYWIPMSERRPENVDFASHEILISKNHRVRLTHEPVYISHADAWMPIPPVYNAAGQYQLPWISVATEMPYIKEDSMRSWQYLVKHDGKFSINTLDSKHRKLCEHAEAWMPLPDGYYGEMPVLYK